MSRFFTAAVAVWGVGACLALLVTLLLASGSNSLGAGLVPFIGGGLVVAVGILGLIVGLIAAVAIHQR
jgi:fumarate reductase subunit C